MSLINEKGRKGRGVRASEGGKEGGEKEEEEGGKSKRRPSLHCAADSEELAPQTLEQQACLTGKANADSSINVLLLPFP